MTLPRYPKYKSSGSLWLGDVPEHWDKSPLKRLAEYQNGYPFKPDDWGDVGLPIVRIAQLDNLDEANYFAGVLDNKLLLSNGDLLFSWSATIDCFIWNSGPAWLNQHIFKVTPTDQVTKTYLFYVIKLVAPKLADVDAHGSTMRHIKKESLNQEVFVPPLHEQVCVGDFLNREIGKVDALVEEQRRLIELLKEKRQAVISHTVTKGLNPDARMKDSGTEWLGSIPEEWEIIRLGRIFREVNEEGVEGLPILSVSIHSGVSDKQLDDEEVDRKVTRSDDQTKYKRVAPADLVYNMMRAWQGGFGTVTVQGMVSPAYVVARPTRAFSSQFVELLLRTPCAIEEMRRYSQGVTDFRLRLYWDSFKSIQIALPSSSEQEKILAYITSKISAFDELTKKAQETISLLQERRTALISAAVTGKIDVRGLAKGDAA